MRLLVGRYILVKQIGKGGFGAVEEYKDRITNENVAIKTIPARYVNQESRRLVREVDIMCFLHDAHPHVIGYFNIFSTKATAIPNHNSNGNEDPLASLAQDEANTPARLNLMGSYYAGLSSREQLHRHQEELINSVAEITKNDEFNVHIVMPLMKGDLFYFIHLLGSQSSVQRLGVTHQYLAQVAVIFAFQICFGLDYLHQCAIVHRDMKPDNVLVRLDINNPYMSTALIADMGLARDAQHSDTIYICTRYYRPPEVITSVSGGSSKTDIWSLGCVFYEMCTGQTLFTMRSALNDRGEWDGAKASLQLEVILNTIGTPDAEDIERYMPKGNAKLYLQRSTPRPSQLRQLIEKNWILQYTGDEKEKWIDLITRCVVFFPELRPTAQQLCQHQLFHDYNIFYGTNVQQYAPTLYSPSFRNSADTSRVENKQSMLSLVKRALQDTMLPDNEEDESSSEEESGSESSSEDSSAESEGEDYYDETPQPPHSDVFDVSVSTHHRDQSHSAFIPTRSDPLRANSASNRDANEESESGVAISLLGVSSSASKSTVAADVDHHGSGNDISHHVAAKKGSALPPKQAAQPNSAHQNAHEYSGHTFIDDDEHADANVNVGAEDHPKPHCPRAQLSPGAHQRQMLGGEATARFSPGNIFCQSPAAMIGVSSSAKPALNTAHSASSEDSGPVIDDTPPLAPAIAFKDRITRRRRSSGTGDEDAGLGGTGSSVLNLELFQQGDKGQCPYDNEEHMLPQSTVPHALPTSLGHGAPRGDSPVNASYAAALDRTETAHATPTEGGSYNYLSQTSMNHLGAHTQQQPQQQATSLYFSGLDDSACVSRLGVGGVKRGSGDAGVHSVGASTCANTSAQTQQGSQGNAAPAAPAKKVEDDQYDYFGDAEYFISPSVSNVAKLTASSSAKEQAASAYLFQLVDSGRAEPPQPLAHKAKSTVAPLPVRHSVTPPLSRGNSGSFPSISNPDLRRRYMYYRHSPRSIQAATSAVLEELGSCTHDAERSSELRDLLNYFTSLKVDVSYFI
ncbi:putative protein kinase [Leptomonas seymouri]|uniref:Protein kinase domain-containing protein n=1 Tax=Leptomonas seymouri TaxID=5684 RepID=A0A0N1IM53_LEPSE|nr:putative protein kinase [Leptomonas seymouri]|eukprot:KPI89482.1 putative protein kinase [Leptomonas seymouri]